MSEVTIATRSRDSAQPIKDTSFFRTLDILNPQHGSLVSGNYMMEYKRLHGSEKCFTVQGHTLFWKYSPSHIVQITI